MIRFPSLILLAALLVPACANEPTVDGKTVSDWIGLLRHQDWTVQEQAQDALTRLGPAAVPYLMRGLNAKDPTLKRGVVICLGKIGPPAKDTVPQMLSVISREEVPVIRETILKSLAAIAPKDTRVKNEFELRLRDVDPDVRAAAQAGLDKLKPPPPPPPKPTPKGEPSPEGGVPDGGEQPAAPKPEFLLRAAVQVELDKKKPGVAFGMVAEVARADCRAAIVWPAMADGKILDDDLVALVFEDQGDKGFRPLGEVGPLGSDAPAKLSEALGGADKQRVIRPCGVARDALQAYLAEHGKAFADALAKGEAPKAMAAYEALTQAFSYTSVAYNDMLPEMLAKGGLAEPWTIDTSAEGSRLPVRAMVAGKPIEGSLELRPCGGGVVISKLEQNPPAP